MTRSWPLPEWSTVKHITGPRWPVSFPVETNLKIAREKEKLLHLLLSLTWGNIKKHGIKAYYTMFFLMQTYYNLSSRSKSRLDKWVCLPSKVPHADGVASCHVQHCTCGVEGDLVDLVFSSHCSHCAAGVSCTHVAGAHLTRGSEKEKIYMKMPALIGAVPSSNTQHLGWEREFGLRELHLLMTMTYRASQKCLELDQMCVKNKWCVWRTNHKYTCSFWPSLCYIIVTTYMFTLPLNDCTSTALLELNEIFFNFSLFLKKTSTFLCSFAVSVYVSMY